MVGHNMAATQTVLWSRILDRLAGPKPPFLIVMDPRRTSVGHAAVENGGIHLELRAGTNLALLNGILKILLEKNEFHNAEFIGSYASFTRDFAPAYTKMASLRQAHDRNRCASRHREGLRCSARFRDHQRSGRPHHPRGRSNRTQRQTRQHLPPRCLVSSASVFAVPHRSAVDSLGTL